MLVLSIMFVMVSLLIFEMSPLNCFRDCFTTNNVLSEAIVELTRYLSAYNGFRDCSLLTERSHWSRARSVGGINYVCDGFTTYF